MSATAWLLAVALGGQARAADAGPIDLNDRVVAVLESYAMDGRTPYDWARGRHDDGVTRRLAWQGTEVAAPAPGGGVHCSGITFEVWLRALEAAVEDPSVVAADRLLALKETWYVRDGDERGPVGALLESGLGRAVDRIEELQPGDLVQFWRNNGNGHSAIFVGHTYRSSGAIRGLIFWSAQSSSSGLGRRYVSVGPGEAQIAPGRLYAARPTVPVASSGSSAPTTDVPPGPSAR